MQDGTTPLHLAALQGHPPMIVLLLANGASVNAEDVDGQTPLFVAAAAGHADAVQALLDARANPGTSIGTLAPDLHVVYLYCGLE